VVTWVPVQPAESGITEAVVYIYGDGTQTRSFCYFTDLVEGLVRLMNTDRTAGPVNLGNSDERTVRDLTERILTLCGSAASIRHEPLPADDPCRRQPDLRLAREVLDWSAKVAIDDGLRATVDYFRQHLESLTPSPG
jgi:UDP-glucuronate decarboxylase